MDYHKRIMVHVLCHPGSVLGAGVTAVVPGVINAVACSHVAEDSNVIWPLQSEPLDVNTLLIAPNHFQK